MTTQELVERLRGTYRIPITDGLGPAGGEEPGNADFFVRTFPTSPLAKAAADRLSEMDAENKRLREALDEVARPMFHMRKRAEASGQRLSDMAYNIAHSLNHVQAIARAALEHDKGEPKP